MSDTSLDGHEIEESPENGLEGTPMSGQSMPQSIEAAIANMDALPASQGVNSQFETARNHEPSSRGQSMEAESPISNLWAPQGLPRPETFQRPAPGGTSLVNATLPEGRSRVQFLAVFSVVTNGTPILFAFSRARLGMVYLGEAQIQQGQYTPSINPDRTMALGAAADLPPNMLAAVLASIRAIELAPNPAERVPQWRTELHSPNSQIRADEACRDCGQLHTVCLVGLRNVRGITHGLCCAQLGRTCVVAPGSPQAQGDASPNTHPAYMSHPREQPQGVGAFFTSATPQYPINTIPRVPPSALHYGATAPTIPPAVPLPQHQPVTPFGGRNGAARGSQNTLRICLAMIARYRQFTFREPRYNPLV